MTTVEEKLAEMGLTLPELSRPAATYQPWRRESGVIYLSGQGPRKPDGSFHVGKVGADVSVEAAHEHAKICGLALIAAMKDAVGDLDAVRVVKVLGMVNAVPDFGDQPKVINGCSDLFVAVFGERGAHARSAVGVGSLPNRMTVEIEAIIGTAS